MSDSTPRKQAIQVRSAAPWLPLLMSLVLLVLVVERSGSSARDGADTGPFPAAG